MKVLGIGSRVNHPDFGFGVVTQVEDKYDIIFQEEGLVKIDLDEEMEIIEATDSNKTGIISYYDMQRSLRNLLRNFSDVSEITQIAEKYRGGTMTLTPADTSLSSKDIKIETFFHKIVMVRDRLRVMEQKINASKNLDDQEKVDLQQYITRIYGSLTTFNVLFSKDSDKFVGSKS